jgi:glucose-1-phosphate adenylyltransferase
MSVSLHRHIRGTYTFDAFDGGFVELLAAQQTTDSSEDWFQGTADAVRKNLRYLMQPGIDHVLILSGDQLYRMDFRDMLRTHVESGADVTIAAKPVDRKDASSLGVMRVNDSGRVVGFLEKPQTEAELNDVAMDPAWIDRHGVTSGGRDCLASMGIYLFRRDTLIDALEKTNHEDFGKGVFPASIRARHVQLHLFDGYWEDIGTIGSFYQANLDLTKPKPPFELASPSAPIYSRPRFLPPTRVDGATINESLIADGSFIEPGAVVENSVIGLRCRIGPGVKIRNSVIMGNDFYEMPSVAAAMHNEGTPPIGIGQGTVIDGALVDKNCRIGANARIVGNQQLDDQSLGNNCVIRDGILVVSKNSVIPDGWSG